MTISADAGSQLPGLYRTGMGGALGDHDVWKLRKATPTGAHKERFVSTKSPTICEQRNSSVSYAKLYIYIYTGNKKEPLSSQSRRNVTWGVSPGQLALGARPHPMLGSSF